MGVTMRVPMIPTGTRYATECLISCSKFQRKGKNAPTFLPSYFLPRPFVNSHFLLCEQTVTEPTPKTVGLSGRPPFYLGPFRSDSVRLSWTFCPFRPRRPARNRRGSTPIARHIRALSSAVCPSSNRARGSAPTGSPR